ncbi:MAG: hypothetical protein FWC86_03210 [Coriobacteriia bacterium]|nr:hypothetical protein [Coriobacteriia bacterium]
MEKEVNFQGYKKQFASNVACSILVHILLTSLGFLGVILGSILQDFSPIAIFFVLAIVGYPILGYTMLQVLPKNNLLSASILALVLTVISVALIAMSMLSVSRLDSFSFVNFPAYTLTTMFVGFDGIIDFMSAEYFAFFLAAFIPSPLMYLGLRFRMYRENRQASAK